MTKRLTIFTWGFWGWGSSTEEFVEAIDRVEKTLGYRPSYLIDIRLRRSGRAPGFISDAFEKTIGRNRYRWMPELGNKAIAEGGRLRINKPAFARELLSEAVKRAKRRQRVIFFCACKVPKECHRSKVATLVLEEAKRQGIKLEIVEWPGSGTTKEAVVDISEHEMRKIARGRKSVDLGKTIPPLDLLGLPARSIVWLKSASDTMFGIGDAAKHNKLGWYLPLNKTSHTDPTALRQRALRDRQRKGFESRRK
jgi:hypothetical protein